MELTVDPADFNLLVEHNVLVVDGDHCSVHKQPKEMVDTCTGWSNHVACQFGPDPDLLALVGKACLLCKGVGRRCPSRPPHPPSQIVRHCRASYPCPTCHGTGSELLTVTTECELHCTRAPLTGRDLGQQHTAMMEAGVDQAFRLRYIERETRSWLRCPDCTDGIRSLLVRLTGQPVPVWDTDDGTQHRGTAHVCFVSALDEMTGPWVLVYDADGNQTASVDLGPDAASLIGRWVWLPDALEVVR